MTTSVHKKISVVGGSGFVGTNLCQMLSNEKIPFEIIDIKPSKRFPNNYKFGDVRDLNSLDDAITGEIVINLAAIHRDDVRDKHAYLETNVDGARNIVEICQKKEISKIIFTSTVAVYGFAKEGADENAPIAPFNEYGRTKYQAENIFRQWQENTANQLIIIRPTVIFGEGNRGNVFNLLNQIASGRFIMIGKGTNKKSMAYIGNVVAFIRQSISADISYGLFNYIDTPDLDMNGLVSQVRQRLSGRTGVGPRLPFWLGMMMGHLADVVALLSRKKLPISAIRVQKFCATTSFQSCKASLNNFAAPYTLQEAIDNTLSSEFLNPDATREIFYTE